MVIRKWKGEAVFSLLLCVLAVVFLRGVVARRVGEREILLHDEGDSIPDSALAHRTERIDPLDHLKKYRGGFNITNKHYWSSAIFTGKFGYIIAVAWLISGLIYASIVIISYIIFYFKGRSEKKRANLFTRRNHWSLPFAVFLTLLAIITAQQNCIGSGT